MGLLAIEHTWKYLRVFFPSGDGMNIGIMKHTTVVQLLYDWCMDATTHKLYMHHYYDIVRSHHAPLHALTTGHLAPPNYMGETYSSCHLLILS